MDFARKLPPHVAVMSPRGLYIASEGGYTWHENRAGLRHLPVLEDFHAPADTLVEFIDEWSQVAEINSHQIDLIGFSQGAAFSYALALFHPDRIRALAALSGFLPAGAELFLAKRPLAGKPVFIAHGRQDDMIPIDLVRGSVLVLKNSGAQVSYCESGGGHKVNKECFKGLVELLR